jgi:hypothetical protein
VQVDFARKQAVVTVESEKYDEQALLQALEKFVLGGEVIKPPTPQDQPASVDKSTKTSGATKLDPDRQIIQKENGQRP